ncbi:MAG: response regulator transcription factor [Candidatus Omnitrophica bacterium]|nr:response regulator transcription factor [Candidatus Omnitrophota bacterium]
MMKERILIVEDDKHISRLVKFNLEKSGYECTVASSGERALEVLDGQPADLVILDIMLPGIDGFGVCRAIKEKERLKNIPIIMLTAKGEEVDRIVGLELGADDYIVKPFSPRELVLRIKAILKRGKAEETKKDVLSAGEITVDIPKHKVTVKGKTIELTQMEFKLLVTLMERRSRVQTRDRLLSDVWDMDTGIDTRTIDTHVKRLREKLGRSGGLIETVRGLGYKFKEEDESR